jgi:hypothetical protein
MLKPKLRPEFSQGLEIYALAAHVSKDFSNSRLGESAGLFVLILWWRL